METLGLYVQIPFCASKCSFCNFSSKVSRAEVFSGYCEGVLREIQGLRRHFDSASVGRGLFELPADTLYFGGGTPPIIGIERLEQIIQAVQEQFRIADSSEFTLETTPGSADAAFLERAFALGVNRLSVGAQSFDDRELDAVGRLHSAADTRSLVEQARRAGCRNISLDLIAGLPHQTPASWRASLEAAVQLQPQHVSVYLFEVDVKSRLGGEVLRHGTRYHAEAVPDDEFMAEAYENARQFLLSRGYAQYEISNFARPGFESKHNLKYWNLAPYIGLGAGAHSHDGANRWANEANADIYSSRLTRDDSPIAELRRLTLEEHLEEFFFLGLRQTQGVCLLQASRRWGGHRLTAFEPVVASLEDRGLLKREGDRIRLAPEAFLFSNEVFQEFLLEKSEAK
ncbi:MAG: radical SAM family heme chaperone HemW [Terriglobia bacterium]